MRVKMNVASWIVCAAACALCACVSTNSRFGDYEKTGTAVGVPKIAFEKQAHDFGTVQPNAPLTHTFVFENRGSAALLIKNVKAG